MCDIANDLHILFKAEGMASPILIGHSLGGLYRRFTKAALFISTQLNLTKIIKICMIGLVEKVYLQLYNYYEIQVITRGI